MKLFLFCQLRAFPLSCCDYFSPPAAAHLPKEPVSVLSLTSMQVPAGCHVPKATSSPGWTVPLPWNAPCRARSPDPWLLWCLFTRPTEFYQHVSCAWGAKMNTITRCGLMRAKKRRIILKISSEWVLACLSLRKIMRYVMVLVQLALLWQSMAQCNIYP